ncbi:hypothetical protein JOQ06_023021, partial [Pogonophryne albipinna]
MSMFPLLIAQVPIGLLGRTRAVRSKLIDRFLPDRMSSWTGTSQLIKAQSKLLEQHASLRDTDKGAHHFAILWASVGNTVPVCFWVLYFLLRDPEALQAVQQEVLEVLRLSGGKFSPEEDLTLSREQLDSMVLLESSISEGLRLSSASTNIRVSQEDFSLRLDEERSASVRKGDVIALYPQSMHMDPEIYQDPQSFRYDRFVQDGRVKTDFYKSGQKLKFFLMPFGSGASMCPGRYFAINEIKQFLSLVLLYLDLDLQPGQNRVSLDYSRAGLGILQPDADVRFHYRLRGASQSPADSIHRKESQTLLPAPSTGRSPRPSCQPHPQEGVPLHPQEGVPDPPASSIHRKESQTLLSTPSTGRSPRPSCQLHPQEGDPDPPVSPIHRKETQFPDPPVSPIHRKESLTLLSAPSTGRSPRPSCQLHPQEGVP